MKYLKKFESQDYFNDTNKIFYEIKDLFYIIEDEGCEVEFIRWVEPGSTNINLDELNTVFTIIFKRVTPTIDLDTFLPVCSEFADRVDEICQKYGYFVENYSDYGLDVSVKD